MEENMCHGEAVVAAAARLPIKKDQFCRKIFNSLAWLMMVAKTPNLIDLSKNRPARYGRRRRILSLFLRHLARYLLTFERTKNYLSSVEIGRERERERKNDWHKNKLGNIFG